MRPRTPYVEDISPEKRALLLTLADRPAVAVRGSWRARGIGGAKLSDRLLAELVGADLAAPTTIGSAVAIALTPLGRAAARILAARHAATRRAATPLPPIAIGARFSPCGRPPRVEPEGMRGKPTKERP